jgi:hypothetical protein
VTIYGGLNGVFFDYATAGLIQPNHIYLRDVCFRSQASAGVWSDEIYGWDNNLIARCWFVSCLYGWYQRSVGFADNKLCYMDKNTFVDCVFDGCGTAMSLTGVRVSNLTAVVRCYIGGSTVRAISAANHVDLALVGSTFVSNAGDPAINYSGGTTSRQIVVGCKFTGTGTSLFVDVGDTGQFAWVLVDNVFQASGDLWDDAGVAARAYMINNLSTMANDLPQSGMLIGHYGVGAAQKLVSRSSGSSTLIWDEASAATPNNLCANWT